MRRIRNSECGIARGRSEKVFINTKKAPVGGRFLLMLFLHRDVRLSRKFVAVAAELLHKHAGIVCSRHQPNRAKGSPEGRRPLGFFHKHAEVVCKCAQFNRAKGSREQLPCGVKGQRPWVTPATHPPATAASRQHPSATRIPARRGSGWRKFRRKRPARTKAAARAYRTSAQGTGHARRIPPRAPVRAAKRR